MTVNKVILYLMSNDNPWVTRQALRGICRYARLKKWHVEPIIRAPTAGAERKRFRKLLRELRPDGVISCFGEGIVGELPPGLPTVWLDAETPDIPSTDSIITHDSSVSVEQAANELLRLGYDHFAAVGNSPNSVWSHNRIDLFRRCILKRRPSATVELFETGCPPDDRATSCRELVSWLSRLTLPCGVFAVCDRTALNVVTAARRLEIDIPNELALVGVDNDEDICQTTFPQLTSVASDWEKAGYMACEALDNRFQDPNSPAVHSLFGDLGIIRRASTLPRSQRPNNIITQACNYIRENACQGIGVMDVVRHLGCSRRLLELRYIEATGHSIFEEIRRAQFAQVLVLLSRRDVPIGIIADMCGWKSPMSLRRFFEKRMQMTMRQWRDLKSGMRDEG